jgi:hypothetical protein
VEELLTAPEKEPSGGLVPEAEPPLEKEEESSITTPPEKGVPKLSEKEALTVALEEQ